MTRQYQDPFTAIRNGEAFQVASMLAALCVLFSGPQELQAAPSRTEWPKRSGPLITNPLPAVLSGIPHGFLGATFHIEQFDPQTTLLQGFVELTNLTDLTNTIVLCLEGPTIAYHIEMLDSKGDKIYDPSGSANNWNAQVFDFRPHEVKRQAIRVRLKDYFDLKPGISQLLFVFDERLLGRLPPDAYPTKAWSRECLVLHCEAGDRSGPFVPALEDGRERFKVEVAGAGLNRLSDANARGSVLPGEVVAQSSERDGRQAVYPLVLGGTNINGVVATFHVLGFDSTDARLRGFVELQNATTGGKEFLVSTRFVFHLRVCESSGKEVPVAVHRTGYLNPEPHGYQIDAGQTVRHKFDLRLRDFWDLPDGSYKVRFQYDLRLFRKTLPGEWPYVAWSTNTFEVRCTGEP
jgi:hypothetical protein